LALWIWKKTFDRVLRTVIRWTMCKLGVEEWLASAVMFMYMNAKSVVRTVYGNSPETHHGLTCRASDILSSRVGTCVQALSPLHTTRIYG